MNDETPIKILVIDDTDFIREDIATTLQFEGHEVITAEDGEVGVSKARSEQPDLILCDVSMPRLDGFGALAEIRKTEALMSTPFVFLTAKTDRESMRKGMELGANDFITKPFTTDELIAAVNTQRKIIDNQRKQRKKIDDIEGAFIAIQGRIQNIDVMFAHELRTPLNGIVMGISFLQQFCELSTTADASDFDELSKMGGMMKESADRLRLMTDKFIQYNELKNKSADAQFAAEMRKERLLDIASTVKDIIEPMSEKYSRNVLFEAQESEAAISMHDFYRLVQELTSNCFKFSPPDSEVLVRGTIHGKMYHLEFCDKGDGMTEEQIKSIGPFVQFDRDKKEQQGVGLGLIIVQKLMDIYGGRLNIHSEYGKETTVQVQIPIPPPGT